LDQHVESPAKPTVLIVSAGGFLYPWQVTNLNNGYSLILVDPTNSAFPSTTPTGTTTYIATGYQSFAQADAYCADVYNGRLASISQQSEWDAAHVSSQQSAATLCVGFNEQS
jgi:hypothetical protein